MKDRSAALREILDSQKAQALLISDLNNIRYLSGFTGSSALLLADSEKTYFLTDGRYKTQSEREVTASEIIIYKKRLDALSDLIQEIDLKSLAFESKSLSYFDWNEINELMIDVKLIPLNDEVRNLRVSKSDDEVALLKKGALIAREAFRAVENMIRPGVREKEIALALEYEACKNGAEKVSFDIIVASGKRSALPHAVPTDKEIESGDLVIIDFGVVIEGYHTDETCTIQVGNVPDEAEEIYHIVQAAHDKAIEAIRPGIKAKDVDIVAREFIDENGYGEYFSHGTGHGVGLEVHELPVLSQQSEETLTEGMVVTVEPGIYLPHLGGVRIEDMVLVTIDGAEIITQCNEYLKG